MINKDNFAATCNRFKEFWAMENHDRPIIYATAPKQVQPLSSTFSVSTPATLKEQWMDIEYIIQSSRARFHSTYFAGESYPLLCPNYGPDFFGAVLGCDIAFGETTTWAVHGEKPFSQRPAFFLDKDNNYWWQQMKALVEAIVEDAKQGDYFVGITDMHPGMDGLVSLRGPQDLCFDLYDEPEEVQKRCEDSFGFYQNLMQDLFKWTGKYQAGSSHWMSIWHPDNWYNISCDFMGMLSEDMFDEFILPQVQKEAKMFGATMFHLDGPGALKHIDKLLAIPELNGIQWVYGAGNPTAAHWIPLLKKIQTAGKCIHIDVEMSDVDPLLEALHPEGLMLCAYCKTQEEADLVVEKAEKSYKKKLF